MLQFVIAQPLGGAADQQKATMVTAAFDERRVIRFETASESVHDLLARRRVFRAAYNQDVTSISGIAVFDHSVRRAESRTAHSGGLGPVVRSEPMRGLDELHDL